MRKKNAKFKFVLFNKKVFKKIRIKIKTTKPN